MKHTFRKEKLCAESYVNLGVFTPDALHSSFQVDVVDSAEGVKSLSIKLREESLRL
jgi:hypothetical protein